MGGKNLGRGINKPQKAGPWSLEQRGAAGEATQRVMGRTVSTGIDRLRGVLRKPQERAREEKPYQPPKVHPNLSLKQGGDMGEVTRRLFGGISAPGIRETGTLSPDRLSGILKAHQERAREEKPYQPPKVHPNLSLKQGGDMGEVTRRLFGGINTPGYDRMSTFLKAQPERKKVRNRRSLMY